MEFNRARLENLIKLKLYVFQSFLRLKGIQGSAGFIWLRVIFEIQERPPRLYGLTFIKINIIFFPFLIVPSRLFGLATFVFALFALILASIIWCSSFINLNQFSKKNLINHSLHTTPTIDQKLLGQYTPRIQLHVRFVRQKTKLYHNIRRCIKF